MDELRVPHRISGTAARVAIGCMLLIMALPAICASKAPLATVLATVGTNTVMSQGASVSRKLAVRASLYAGDVVSTDTQGKATLLFSNGSQARLAHNSCRVFIESVP